MDRRLNPRKHLQLNITLETPSSSQPLTAYLRDISVTGAFIETETVLSTSAPLIMAFKLSDSVHNGFRLYARVIRRTKTGVGVAFLPMPSEMTNALSKALSRYKQRPADAGH